MKLIEICWVDSTSNGDHWIDKEIAINQVSRPIKSAGYLLYKDKEKITIVQGYGDNDTVINVLTIPMGCVKDIKRF